MSATPTMPEVFIITETLLDREALWAYFAEIGAVDWFNDRLHSPYDTDRSSDEEMLVEIMGRLCYRSFGTDLNPNITRIRDNPKAYFQNLLNSGHGSVLEHVNISMIFQGVSRVFTHELVRHRAGTAFSQESLRFVRLEDFNYYEPDIWQDRPDLLQFMRDKMTLMSEWQVELAQMLNLDGMDFNEKKAHTSAMRRLAPIGLSTAIGFTANIRALRWIIQMRSDPAAEEEIRTIAGILGSRLKERWPLLFGDFDWSFERGWHPHSEKV